MTSQGVFELAFISVFMAAILYVVLGQITVRKLRKNPETKNELGAEFASGWDIVNVAQALTFPFLIRKFNKTRLGFLYADPDLLIKHTNKLDRVLAISFYGMLIVAGGLFIILALVEGMSK